MFQGMTEAKRKLDVDGEFKKDEVSIWHKKITIFQANRLPS